MTGRRDNQAQGPTARPYDPPRLTVMGTVSELTLGPHDHQPAPPGGHVLVHSR